MPVLCDFQVIQGDTNKRIGDTGVMVWETNFNTGGRHSGGNAILMFMVKGLTVAENPVDVKINNKSVGKIYPYTGANANQWFTQIINIGSGILRDGSNELQIEAVSYPGAHAGDLYDDFELRDVICFFQQAS